MIKIKHSSRSKLLITAYSMAVLLGFGLLNTTSVLAQTEEVTKRTPYEIVDQAPDDHWRDINLENTLYIQLETGTVVVEMNPDYAPNHVKNTKQLVRSGVFDNTSFYRVIDGFVAQGGPSDPEKIKSPAHGQLSIAAEFSRQLNTPINFTPLNAFDGYADEVGYVNGYAVGRNKDKTNNWLLHCYGALAMGRANESDSGGTELYIVIGAAQRYLDRNTTVFGKVISGMEHVQALKRSSGISGSKDVSTDNKILKITVASDQKKNNRDILQIMKTDSSSFKDLIESRKNRTGEWFVHQHDYIDVCSVAVPVRLKTSNNK